MTERSHFMDLRSFGAIGFQDAPNDLWLAKQGYRPESLLLSRLSDHVVTKGVTISAITTEDDKVLPTYPEDRFGFLASWSESLQGAYSGEKIDDVLLRVQTPKGVVYWVNSETVSPMEGVDWGGLKVHVIGANDIHNKWYTLGDLVSLCNDRGLLSFLFNTGANDKARHYADNVIHRVTGVIGHDANNVFPFGRNSKGSNSRAEDYAIRNNKPSIAVSSSHWMHEIGNAGIHTILEDVDLTSGRKLIDALGEKIRSGAYYPKKGNNGMLDVVKFISLLRKYGGSPQRFAGASSSYNH